VCIANFDGVDRMAMEIERKFLVLDERWRAQVERSERMEQGYLAGTDACSVRVRIVGDSARLNVKSAGLDIQRQEYEYEIPVTDAREILDTLCGTRVVRKTRHYVTVDTHLFEIDEFEGDNAPLVVVEVELGRRDEEFARPVWLGAEVSGDKRYLNSNLADLPYSRW
jgi:adenylate cyclase